MRSVESAQQVSPPVPLTARAVLDAWSGITRVEIRAALLLLGILVPYHIIVFSNGLLAGTSLVYPLMSIFVVNGIGVLALLLAVVVADRVTGKDGHRRAAYALAVVVSAAIAAPLQSIAGGGLWHQFTPEELKHVFTRTFYIFFEWLVLGGVATFIYTDRRRARAALARMRAAEIGRAHAAKRTLESRLQAMQARVEPQFLFNTLAQVKKLYQLDAASGERMFDELIAYLRAAMPKMRDTSSTVGQEIDLARAYLAIVKVRLGDRLTYAIDVPEDIGDARMPPMMLLPLIDHALVRGAEPSDVGSSIAITARVDGERLTLTVGSSDPAFALDRSGDDGIKSIRERLETLYGKEGSLELENVDQCGTRAIIKIPRERIDRGERA